MGRRVGVMLAVLVAMLFIATESVWACKCLDNLYRHCRVRRCCPQYYCVCYCCAPCCTVVPSCCEPAAVAEPAEEAPPVDAPTEAPLEAPPEAPLEAPPEAPLEEPPEAPPEEPTPEPAAPEPAEKPAVEPPAVEPPAVEPPAVEPPAEEPAAEPAPEPVPTPDDDPFAGNDPGGLRLWTDITGKYQVEARFVSLLRGGRTVRLQKPNGRYVWIVEHKLSLADRQFVGRYIGSLATTW